MDVKILADYKRLDTWQKAFSLATEIYRITNGFPQTEVYGLGSQLRRYAVSVVSNIAEGAGRRTTKDSSISYILLAGLSLSLRHSPISKEIGLISTQQPCHEQIEETARLLNGLIRRLEQKIADGKSRR